MTRDWFLGLDLGSVNGKAVLLDDSLRIQGKWERKSLGDPAIVLAKLLEASLENLEGARLRIGLTGYGREMLHSSEIISSLNEIIALSLGARYVSPGVISVVEIGGQTSKWLSLQKETVGGFRVEIQDYALNERCAAGAGAFIEQQAKRLKLTIDEFSSLAASAGKGAAVAGRCSVFAKSDMIHHQQKGTPVPEIAYGLCLAMARNFVGTVLKGKKCHPPVLFSGGGARNAGLLKAFREILRLDKGLSTVPEAAFVCAIGAALFAQEHGQSLRVSDWNQALDFFRTKPIQRKSGLPPLEALDTKKGSEPRPSGGQNIEAYLGVDVGSVSTNLALVDRKGKVKAGVYLPTRGRPLEALKEGFGQLLRICNDRMTVIGIGTTGSGRYLAGKFLESDVIYNEITSQMVGTLHFFPDADTIFEIGGQDSKFISVQEGQIRDFTMNKICSAGTGSFLEEQAEHLDIKIEDQFSNLAVRSESPFNLGCQCTVFMDTELANAVNRGVSVPDITAGLAYAIVRNYLEKVVMNRTIGDKIVFQGGVASNPSVVKAFSHLLDTPINVHPHNRISGAIGAALLSRDSVEERGRISPDTESLIQRLHQEYTVKSFQCRHCSNSCQVNQIHIGDEDIYFGDTCERYTSKQKIKRSVSSRDAKRKFPDLFREREDKIQSLIENPPRPSFCIGLPKASFMHEYIPFWTTFFNDLGCEVVLSPDSNMATLEEGLNLLPAETCLPIKLAFGHVEKIDAQDVDWIFFPSVLAFEPKDTVPLCPYGEHIPYMIKSAVDKKIHSPSVDFEANLNDLTVSLSSIRKALGVSPSMMQEALVHATHTQNAFTRWMAQRGSEIMDAKLGGPSFKWVILGKPYNLYDPFLNLNLNRHIRNLGILGVPMNFLPFERTMNKSQADTIAWRYNFQILQSARWCSENDGVYPVIVSNFGCGPDAFMHKHLVSLMREKPYLFLEFDEHRAEAGLITRLEAFKDEVMEAEKKKQKKHFSGFRKRELRDRTYETLKKKPFVLPYFTDHVYAFSGALQGTGIRAEVLPPPDRRSLELGEKQVSGKECHAFSLLAGDMIKLAMMPRTEEQVYFFPGSKVTCLLHQYEDGLKYILDDMKIEGLDVLAPPFEFLFGLLGTPGLTLLYRGLMATDVLIKAACERRPYETDKGMTDRIHRANMLDVEKGLASNSYQKSLKKCVDRLNSIPIRKEQRPVVGIAGDIYTRHNPVGNNDLFSKLEDLGCEVWPAPFLVDSIDFGLRKNLQKAIRKKRLPETLSVGLMYLKKELESRKIKKSLRGALSRLSEPTYKEIVTYASPYLGVENVDVLVLNIAKMVDFARRGADGVVNAICLNCMIGTISEALASRVRKDMDNIPIPTLIFGGSDLPSDKAKLEAFVYQVHQFAEKRKQNNSLHA